MIKKILFAVLVATSFISGCKDDSQHPAYEEKRTNLPEFVAQAPDGTLSPVFNTMDEVKAYIESHPNEFPGGTIIYDR